MQAAHKTDIGCPEIFKYLLGFMMFSFKNDRLPTGTRKSLVDPGSQSADIIFKMLVLTDQRTGGSGDLNKCEFTDPFWIELEKPLDSQETPLV